ncbi:Nucleotidyltransferase [Whalleya microplaca]|nr:Nucleotidyltransferase [Whalleya microplaca]
MSLEFPPIFLLPTHIEPNKLPDIESQIPSLTYDIDEAPIILGKIANKERAKYELRRRKLLVQDINEQPGSLPSGKAKIDDRSPPTKRRKVVRSTESKHGGNSSTASDSDSNAEDADDPKLANGKNLKASTVADEDDGSVVKVVKLAWFTECLTRESVLPVDPYLVYEGRKIKPTVTQPLPDTEEILKRARQEGNYGQSSSKPSVVQTHTSTSKHPRTSDRPERPTMIPETTSEHDRALNMPPIPDYLHTTYSCQRPTPVNPPNDAFIEDLKKVRSIRALADDEVGVRAYSTSIASLAAYPYLINSAAEVSRLPGCSDKIAALWKEWKAEGCLREVEETSSDPKLSVLRLFYEIWGVAATTAREFYRKGWRDLDDIVEYGWDNISRVQQIGVKYYEELQEKIPRSEVEQIGDIILRHARKLHKGCQMVIVGGYRRGKAASGDVDVMLSYPDSAATRNFVLEIVTSLEKDKYITHTLTLSTKNSERGQTPVAWKGQGTKAGAGFDTLDKALVVWQDPKWDKSASAKNPNLHRRVDIIISPWKTAGCAVIGWTGGTTFQRDLRRYCKYEKGLKFDSSGVRSRTDGSWVDLESDEDGPAPDMLTAEKRVFQRLGLEWRRPEERCTG